MRTCFIVIFLISYSVASAQHVFTEEDIVPVCAVRVSPAHLVNFYPTLEISYEQRIWKRITLQGEVGYVIDFGEDNSNYNDEENMYQNKRGVKLKLETRYYMPWPIGNNKVFYGSAEPYWNIINFDRETSAIECFDVECMNEYKHFYNYKMKYRESGVSIKMGYMWYFGRFFMDVNSGLTIRSINYITPEGYPEYDDPDNGILFNYHPDETRRTALSPCIGIRIGYRIK